MTKPVARHYSKGMARTMSTGDKVRYSVWNASAKALTEQVGTVKKIYGGQNPLVLIEEDDSTLRGSVRPLKLRASALTRI